MKIKNVPNKNFLGDIGKHAESLGLKCWVVGGCVRDWILKRETNDMDIVCENDCLPLALYCQKKYGGELVRFDKFGTIRVSLPTKKLDFARSRGEVYVKPAALPNVFPSDISNDLFRRDFSVNALAMSILPDSFGEVLDMHRSLEDIKVKKIRILHDKSFQDDPTRLFRACRFAARFNWKFDSETERLFEVAIRENYPALLSRERIKNELLAFLRERNPGRVFKLADRYNLTGYIYRPLKWNASAAKSANPFVRLGVLACKNENGLEFLKSLELDRKIFIQLKVALETLKNKMSPKQELTKSSEEVILLSNPKISKVSLKPLLLNGNDLKALGFEDQKEYSDILTKLAKAQWQKKFPNKTVAKHWLLKNLKSR
jgi:tRNA nucleotidyltransferase/poly(A) polymerase